MNPTFRAIFRCVPWLMLAAHLGRGTPARAQPVATADKAVRLRTGWESLPITDEETGKRVFEQRALVTVSYRFFPNVDLGLALPTVRVQPDVAVANPQIVSFIHIFHDPNWLALHPILEPPLFTQNDWRTTLLVASNLRSIEPFEFFNLVGPTVPLSKPEATILVWRSALLARVIPVFAIGPEVNLRFDKDGFEDYALGGRFRWEVKHHEKTLAALYLSATFPTFPPDVKQMNLLGYVQWYFRV